MKNGKTILYRVYQGAMALALRVLPEKKQELVTGNGSFLKAAVILKQHGVHKVQIVTTAGTVRRGTLAPLLSALESEGIEAAVFDAVRPKNEGDPQGAQEASVHRRRPHHRRYRL